MEDQNIVKMSGDLELKLSTEDFVNSDEESENDNAKLTIKESTNYLVVRDDMENGASFSEPSSVKNCEEKMNNNLGDKTPSIEVVPCIYSNLDLSLVTNETDETKIGLEEAQGLIKFEDKVNDKCDYKTYEEKENINEEAEKNVKPKLKTSIYGIFMDPEDIAMNKKMLSTETVDEKFVCPSCNHDLPLLGDGFTVKLEKCHHTVCRWCINKILENILQNKIVEPRCPYFYGDQCESLIEEHEIRELVEPKLYEAYLEKSINKIKEDANNNIFHCQSATCKAWYILEDNNVKIFVCTLCNMLNKVDTEINKKTEEPIPDIEKYIQSERYNEILLLSKSVVVPNFESFECPICFVQYEPLEGLILKNCLHTFCKECIANVVLYSEDADIKCPYKNDDYSCDETILQSEIRAVVQPDDFQKYLQKSVAQAERKAGKSAYHCKTPNCPDWCFVELGVDHFLCPTCKEDNCFLCEKIHTGRGCVDDIVSENADAISQQSADLIEIMLLNGNALRCPTCKAVITKAEGCDAVTCASCRTEICWVTRGPRWGPNGKGDKSGGCRCEAFAKCHPDCRNCH